MHKYISTLIMALLLTLPARAWSQDDHDKDSIAQRDSVDHDHDDLDSTQENLEEQHDGEDGEELVVELTSEAVQLAGISLAYVIHGSIERTVDLPGEVSFNEDRLVHIAPRFAGIALEASCRVGDHVNAGDTVAIVESNESMNAYSIEAPISGWVIARHITKGEYVSGENSVYVIADLSTVWVNLAVYPKDIDRIKTGQEVNVTAIGSSVETRGTIEYVTPVLDVRTRSVTARVILPNPKQQWRPGTFVKAHVVTGSSDEGLVIEKEAVQLLDSGNVVFVPDGSNRFRPVEVIIGDSDDRHTRILAGLEEGREYVSRGAFELKAVVVTSALGGHAGHGH